MKNISVVSIFLFLGLFQHSSAFAAKWMVVVADVADVRSEPKDKPVSYDHDPLQETQVQKGEWVRVLKVKDGWAFVNCPSQLEYTHNDRWEGYPGWVRLTALGRARGKVIATREPAVKDDVVRAKIVDHARTLIGSPYFWGGRSEYNPSNTNVTTGVDCSGLVNLSYWKEGWTIPRDAHEQFMKATRIEALAMKPADLIFLSSADRNNRVTHVLMMASENTVIEAPQTGERVREMSFDQRLGVSRSLAKNGDRTPDGRTIYFGRFFPTETR